MLLGQSLSETHLGKVHVISFKTKKKMNSGLLQSNYQNLIPLSGTTKSAIPMKIRKSTKSKKVHRPRTRKSESSAKKRSRSKLDFIAAGAGKVKKRRCVKPCKKKTRKRKQNGAKTRS